MCFWSLAHIRRVCVCCAWECGLAYASHIIIIGPLPTKQCAYGHLFQAKNVHRKQRAKRRFEFRYFADYSRQPQPCVCAHFVAVSMAATVRCTGCIVHVYLSKMPTYTASECECALRRKIAAFVIQMQCAHCDYRYVRHKCSPATRRIRYEREWARNESGRAG